jgi:phospholipase C
MAFAFAFVVLAAVSAIHSSITQLQHVIIITQENRSFDSYFGTYPGADGIPMHNGKPTICNPNPQTHHCDYSYHDTSDKNYGGPHDTPDEIADVDHGKMDGFVAEALKYAPQENVMGYHTAQEIPNYWSYARNYVLQDQMFGPSTSWSLNEHLFLVSNWSAHCATLNDPMSCTSGFVGLRFSPGSFAWTDITWLLYHAGVSWKYYVAPGTSPDVINPGEDGGPLGRYESQGPSQASQWNPLPDFTDVIADNQLGNIVSGSTFYNDAANGTLPAVSWIVPSLTYSEHPPQSIAMGMKYVSGLVNAVMQGPDWSTSAIFITYDEWGGMFDHVQPTSIDWAGYGLRVPALIISPWARPGLIDHQLMSFDAYDKLIEDVFLGGQRLDPSTDGRPDPRPDVRENYSGLGDLLNDFNFGQTPRPPLILRNALKVLR